MAIGSFVRHVTETFLTAASQAIQLEPRDPPIDPTAAVTLDCGEPSKRFLAHPPSAAVAAVFARQLRTRREWLDIPGINDQINGLARIVLASVGINQHVLEAIAAAGTVQLTFPSTLPAEALDFPWEFAIAEATRPLRRRVPNRIGRAFLAYRYLDVRNPNGVSAPPLSPAEPTTSLVVRSAPGALQQNYSFESECRLVSASLNLGGQEQVDDPDLAELEAAIRNSRPSVIHLAGIDARQARALLGSDAESSLVPPGLEDGMCLRAGVGGVTIIGYDVLAERLAAAGGAELVALNLYNSSRGAMAAVRAGAKAAIGFQDDIDDLVAEQFFASFYAQWKRSGWDLLSGFLGAWSALAPAAAKIRGTGIVLWTRVPLLELRGTGGTSRQPAAAPRSFSRAAPPPAAAPPSAAAPQTATAPSHVTPPAVVPHTAVVDPSEHIDVEYEPPKQLNYSLLHNNANIVPKLVLRRQKPGVYRSITVQVTVSAGAQEASYRATLTLDDAHPKDDVHDKVRIPLTSELTRTLDESLFSTIYVAVRWGDHILREETHRVAFMPVDEWRYDDANARWLPSFVFPRDPVVRDIVTTAQRYLTALRDDSTAGFDGYQSFEPAGTSIAEQSRHIDAQVQAIWWALINDYALGYINPPPNYSDEAQRLRTPSEVIQGRRGTCIDLALLLAACLEYVEIYPVLFLLNDHAFPGYWRSDASYEMLGQLSLKATSTSDGSLPIVDRDMHPDPWMIGRGRFADISALIQQGHIVPLETVSITSRDGFWSAVKDGVANLRSKRQFHSLFDLPTARTKVTPIPIWSKRI